MALELSQPIDCTPGKDCFIQQYVDRDEGPGVQDYACGAETYDGHKGTDIRLRTTADVEKGVAVKASAEGTVVGLRDGVDGSSGAFSRRPGRDQGTSNAVTA